MKVFISQPRFLPNISYIERIAKSDVFVVMDNVQYTDRFFDNRNKVLVNGRPHWLSVPIKGRHQGQLVNSTKINYDHEWQETFLKTLSYHYKKTPFFYEIYPKIENILKSGFDRLIDLNMATIRLILEYLEIPYKVTLLSGLPISKTIKGSDLIYEVCRQTGATTCICGELGKNYLNEEKFRTSGIDLEYVHNNTTPYPQSSKDSFVPLLSIIDLLFNCGKSSVDLLRLDNKIKI